MHLTLLQLRNNLGVTADNLSTPPSPELIPPITLIIPWLFQVGKYFFIHHHTDSLIWIIYIFLYIRGQALNLSDSFEKGKLYAYRLLCTLTVRKHDITLSQYHVIEFYKFLHQGLIGRNQVMYLRNISFTKFLKKYFEFEVFLIFDVLRI